MLDDSIVEGQWRPSQWYNALYFAVGGLAVVLGTAAARQGLNIGIPWLDMMVHTVWVGGVMLILWKYMEVRCTCYQLSTEQLSVMHGVLNQVTDNMELYRIKDIQVLKPFWLRPMGLGSISILSSDKTTPTLLLIAISKPANVALLLREFLEAERVKKGVREFD